MQTKAMTNGELEAGADAVHALAEKYGVSFWINRDKEREIASEVIKAFVAAKDEGHE